MSHTTEKKRLARIAGQVAGIGRMIEERRYCVDILTQIKATRAALASLERSVLESHLRGCVRSAMSADNERDAETKIQEILEILS